MTTVEGTYALCGGTWVLDFTCSGPQCGVFANFPDVTCSTAGAVVTCTSATLCDGPAQYSSAFTYNQPGANSVTVTDSISIPEICEQIEVVSDFTRGGTTIAGSDTPACVPDLSPPASCSPVSSSSVASSSSVVSSSVSSSVPPSSLSSSVASSSVETSSVVSSLTVASPISSSSAPPSTEPSSTPSSSAVASSSEWCDEASSVDPSSTAPRQSEPIESSSIKPSLTEPSSSGNTDGPRTETSTILSTRTYTITSCKPTVTKCPVGHVTTEVITSYSTYCPDDEPPHTPGAPQTNGGGEYVKTTDDARPWGPAATDTKTWVPVATEVDTLQPANTAGNMLPPGVPSPTSTHNATAPLSAPSTTVFTAGARRTQPPSLGLLWCGILLVFGFLAQGATALAPPTLSSRSLSGRSEPAVHNRQAVGNAVAMADKLIAHFSSRVPGSDLGETLVKRILDIGCDLAIEDGCGPAATDLALSKPFAVDFTDACRTAVLDLSISTSPEVAQTPGAAILLSVDAGLLCNFMLGSFFHAPELVAGVCAYPKPCSDDFTTDPNNCGRCGSVCPGGTCQNSICLAAGCAGQTCDTFTACGPGGSCVCASVFEGAGVCGDGQTPCAGLADCGSSADCASGFVCVVGTCCTRNVCIAATSDCSGSTPGTTPANLLSRTYENATVGDRGAWA